MSHVKASRDGDEVAKAILSAMGARSVLVWTSDGRTLASEGWDVGREALDELRTAFGAEEGPAEFESGHDTLGAVGRACPEECDRFCYVRTSAEGAGLLFGLAADAPAPGGLQMRGLALLAALATSSHFDDDTRFAGARLATVGEIVNGIAHDIGTPLNVISGYAESMLMAESDEPSPRRKQMSAIVEQTRRIADMVRQMLDIVRPLPDHATRNRTLELFAGDILHISSHMLLRRDVRCRLDAKGAGAAVVSGDLPQLAQAIVSVLRGAAGVIGAKGQVVLRPVSETTHGTGLFVDIFDSTGAPADLSSLEGDRRHLLDEVVWGEHVLREHGATLEILRDGSGPDAARLFIRLGTVNAQDRS